MTCEKASDKRGLFLYLACLIAIMDNTLFPFVLLYLVLLPLIVYRVFFRVIEPLYISMFNKPVYVHFYPIRRKLSQSQLSVLRNEVRFFARLSMKRQQYFEHRVACFIESYSFHGRDGLAISEAMRIKIAASYVMLTFGMRTYRVREFDKIILYPGSFLSTATNAMHNGEFNPQLKAVVFSWEHFEHGFLIGNDNLNLGIHEFTHVMHHSGIRSRLNQAAIFATMYGKIIKEVKHPPNAQRLLHSNYFRAYAYTNEYEFLAVILENFFETPEIFEQEFPELYANVRQMINYRG